MRHKILLTSFETWLPHQKSNSSDDLLAKIQRRNYSSLALLFFLRNLPVDIELASKKVISEVERIQPDVIICCGMAEKREKLAVESNAVCQNKCLYTSVDLVEIGKILANTEISHDAGKFVCEGLYYEVLKYIGMQGINTKCIFVHIPIWNDRSHLFLRDFHFIILYFVFELAKVAQAE